MNREPLSEENIRKELANLPGWSLADGALHRAFKFADFMCAFGFMSAAALAAEKMDHHPNWSNVYNTVVVDLSTHDVRGITEFDIVLARRMSELAGKFS